MNFSLMYHHQKDPRMFDDMIPFERDLYIGMFVQKIEEENEKMKLEQSAARAAAKRGR